MSLPASVMHEQLRRSVGFFAAHDCRLAAQSIQSLDQPEMASGVTELQSIEWFEFLVRPCGRFAHLTPDRFVRQMYASEVGLDLDRMVAGLTLGWMAEQDYRVRASINIHPSSLGRPEFVDGLLETVDELGLDADQICLELVEFAEPVSIGRIRHGVEEIKAAGVMLALDDYGKGLPNFDLCGEGAVDFIKIDRSFVEHININAHHEGLIRGVYALAREMNIQVVAEGVERPSQLTTLRRLGIQWVQGYLLHRPTLVDI